MFLASLTTRLAFFISILTLIVTSSLSCKNEKVERVLVGEWDIVNSRLSLMDSNILVHQADYVGSMSLSKNKIDRSLIDLNKGNWQFENFPDTLVQAAGDLSWTSTDKGDFNKIPWEMDIYFSASYQKDIPVLGSYYFDCFQGRFTVLEIKKRKHYSIRGYIYKPDKPYYSWNFELKRK